MAACAGVACLPATLGKTGDHSRDHERAIVEAQVLAIEGRRGFVRMMTYATKGNQRTWTLTPAQVDVWQTVYPAVDVAAECRKAWAWIDANPSRRKTGARMKAFLVAWLNKAAPRPEAPAPAPVREKTDIYAWAKEQGYCQHRPFCAEPGGRACVDRWKRGVELPLES